MRSYLRILVGMVALSFVQPALAQIPGLGFNPEGVFQHGDIDSVNLENLNATIQIPLFSYPQRGAVGTINFNLYANTNVWGPTYVPDTGIVPTGEYDVNFSSLGPSINIPQLATISEADNFYIGSGTDGQHRLQANWWVQEADGGMHTLVVDANSIASPNTQANADYRTADGSGYVMTHTAGFADGQGRNRLAIGSDGWQHPGIVDSDGNTVSSTGSRWIYAPQIVDTLGRSIPDPNFFFFFRDTPPAPSSRCPTNIQDGGAYDTQPLVSSTNWTVPGVGGGTVTYLICFAEINVRTNFWQYSGNQRINYYCEGDPGDGCGGAWRWNEQSSPETPVIQSIVLPDGTYWGFRYDSADPREVSPSPPSGYPHACANDLSVGPASYCAYGVITKIIEPTGGSISYDYALQADGAFNASPYVAYLPYITKRTVNPVSGSPMVWQYTSDSSLYGGSTVHDPAGNAMVVGYSGTVSTTSPTYTKSQIWYDSGGTIKKEIDSTYTKIFGPAPLNYPGYYTAIADLVSNSNTTVDGSPISQESTGYSLGFYGTAMQCAWDLSSTSYDDCDNGNGSTFLSMGIPSESIIKDGSGSVTYKSSYTFPIAVYGNSYCTNGDSIADYWNHNFLTQPSYTKTDDGTNTLRTNYCYDESGHTVTSSSLGSPGTLGLGHVTTVSSLSGVDTHNYWTKYGLLDHVVDPKGYTAAIFQYDSSTTGGYAKALAPTSVATAVGTETYSYDYNTGLPLSHTDVNSKTTNYAYDAMQRPWSVQNPDVSSGYSAVACYSSNSVTVYRAQGSSALSRPGDSSSCPSSSSALVSTQNVDGLGRTISSVVHAPEGNIETDTAYDVMGRVATVSTPFYSGTGATSWTANSYDAISRPSSVNVGTTSLTTLNGDSRSWSYGGLSTTVTDGRSNQTTTVVDPVGRVVDVYEPTAPSTSPTLRTHYAYNIYGLYQVFQCGTSSLSACTSASTSRTRTFGYDGMGRLTSAANPETGTVSYYYDLSGTPCAGDPSLPCRKIDARSIEQRFTYDYANRLTAKTYPYVSSNVVSCYRYDTVTNGIGQLGDEWTQIGGACSSSPADAAAVTPSSQLITQHSILAYDAMGRVTQEKRCAMGVCTSGAPVIDYNYDLAGNVTAYTNGMPGGVGGATAFANQYDSAGRLTTVTSSWNDWSHPGLLFSAQNFGAYGLTGAAIGNHLNLTKIYDQQMRVKEQTVLAH